MPNGNRKSDFKRQNVGLRMSKRVQRVRCGLYTCGHYPATFRFFWVQAHRMLDNRSDSGLSDYFCGNGEPGKILPPTESFYSDFRLPAPGFSNPRVGEWLESDHHIGHGDFKGRSPLDRVFLPLRRRNRFSFDAHALGSRPCPALGQGTVRLNARSRPSWDRGAPRLNALPFLRMHCTPEKLRRNRLFKRHRPKRDLTGSALV
jgi:hypothetical protein